MDIPSNTYYDQLAQEYSGIYAKRANYLNAVDDLIFQVMDGLNVINYLDIGCGDGTRSLKIIERIKPNHAVLIDNSEKMLESAKSLYKGNISFIHGDVLHFRSEMKFDLITCLWNVIGHFPDKQYKIAFFKSVKHLLTDKGVFIFDVNNRYNMAHYGFRSVARNMINDVVKANDRGSFRLQIGSDSHTNVYIHHPYELESILHAAGFRMKDKHYINYASGSITRNPLGGQLYYCISK